MSSEETVTLTRAEYEALLNHSSELEDRLAALDAEDGSRVPHGGGCGYHSRQKSYPCVPGLPRHHAARSLRKHRNLRQLPIRDRMWTQTWLHICPDPHRRRAGHDDRRLGQRVVYGWPTTICKVRLSSPNAVSNRVSQSAEL